MPKIKGANKEVSKNFQEDKIVEIETGEKDSDVELIQGEETDDELENDSMLDDDEVDPFKDKWEE